MSTIPHYQTENESYGFYATIASGRMIQEAIARLYSIAAHAITEGNLVEHEYEAISFLDSRQGRHLADQVGVSGTEDELTTKILNKAAPYIAQYRKEAGR